MPLLDVSEVLSDPMFADCIQVTRRPQAIDQNGRVTTPYSSTFNAMAVVTQGSPEAFEQNTDDMYSHRMITVHTLVPLYDAVIMGAQTYLPDIITYNNNPYIVKKIYDWSRYGQGFTMAVAEFFNQTPVAAS